MSVSRLFIAAPVSESFRKAVAGIRSTLAAREGFRWVPEANLHLTACFIGDVYDIEIPNVAEIMARAAQHHRSFSLEFDHFGAAGHPTRPSMLWGYYRSNDAYRNLHSALGEELKPWLKADAVRFSDPIPHITIARTSRHSVLRNLPPFNQHPGSLEVNRFALWKTLREPALHYEQLAETLLLK